MSLLQRFASGFRLHLKTFYSPGFSLASRRWVYYPNLSPPRITEPASQAEFPEPSVPYLPREKFEEIVYERSSQESFTGLYTPPKPRVFSSRTPEETWFSMSTRPTKQDKPLDRFAGRSVPVQGKDIGAAWNRLQAVLRQNNIRHELRMTERHEKKGVKRRRLRSERWKRKFADEVGKKVRLVNEIRLRDRMWGARH